MKNNEFVERFKPSLICFPWGRDLLASMDAIDESLQLFDSMWQAAALLAGDEVDETPSADSSKRASTFLHVVDPRNIVVALLADDRTDDCCDTVLVKSPDPECSTPDAGRDRPRVILTNNNDMSSHTRFTNALRSFSSTRNLRNGRTPLWNGLETHMQMLVILL